MDIDVRQQGSVSILRLKGPLKGADAAAAVREAVDSVISQGNSRLVFNLSAMPVLDSSGISEIVLALRAAKKAGGNLLLVNPSKFTSQTLKIVGVLNLFQIFEDEQQATASYMA